MAYMNQEKKAKIAAAVKPILKKYKVKGSLSVRNNSTILLTITEGSIDFIKDFGTKNDYIQVNPYWYQDHFTGKSKKFLSEVLPALYSADYYDRSDVMTDYFDTAYYVNVSIGRFDKPYKMV